MKIVQESDIDGLPQEKTRSCACASGNYDTHDADPRYSKWLLSVLCIFHVQYSSTTSKDHDNPSLPSQKVSESAIIAAGPVLGGVLRSL